jgi:hypothetical protein
MLRWKKRISSELSHYKECYVTTTEKGDSHEKFTKNIQRKWKIFEGINLNQSWRHCINTEESLKEYADIR